LRTTIGKLQLGPQDLDCSLVLPCDGIVPMPPERSFLCFRDSTDRLLAETLYYRLTSPARMGLRYKDYPQIHQTYNALVSGIPTSSLLRLQYAKPGEIPTG